MELWKDIPGYEGYYQVSDLGFVKSLPRLLSWNGTMKVFPSVILKPATHRKGYKAVGLVLNGKITVKVHKLVMLAFRGPMPEGCELIMHLNDDPSDNRLINLKYGTHSENAADAFSKGRRVMPNLEQEVIAIHKQTGERAHFKSYKEAAETVGVCHSAICNVKAGRSKSTKNHHYQFL